MAVIHLWWISCSLLSLPSAVRGQAPKEKSPKAVWAPKVFLPSVHCCTASDHFSPPIVLLAFRIYCDIHDICFILRPEQSREPAFHSFSFLRKACHTAEHQNGSEKGKKKPCFSGQFHNLNRKGAGESVFIFEIFLNPQARNAFLLLFERNTVALGMNKPLQRKMLFSSGWKFFPQNSWEWEVWRLRMWCLFSSQKKV